MSFWTHNQVCVAVAAILLQLTDKAASRLSVYTEGAADHGREKFWLLLERHYSLRAVAVLRVTGFEPFSSPARPHWDFDEEEYHLIWRTVVDVMRFDVEWLTVEDLQDLQLAKLVLKVVSCVLSSGVITREYLEDRFVPKPTLQQDCFRDHPEQGEVWLGGTDDLDDQDEHTVPA